TPWPDEKPLGLKVQVLAKNPLQAVNLLIRSGKRESKETVHNVMTDDVFTVDTNYSITLENYVEADMAEVEIIAQAIDRSSPIPLVGYSDPLRIQTASAYGRYQATLNTLKELKIITDTNLSKQQAKFSPEAIELMKKAQSQSEDSPFFDGMDRMVLEKFTNQMETNFTEKQFDQVLTFSNDLNDFLEVHEGLDDRERDRDFFVAARTLSRLLEKNKNQRPVAVAVVAGRIKEFLDVREARWKARVARIGSFAPASWVEIGKNRPFHKAMDQIIEEDKLVAVADKKSLELLAGSVTKYRDWLNELEAAEDKSREEKQKEREQGLADARDEIRELQKTQGQISAKLDRSIGREQQELQDSWPLVNMNQNANINKSKGVEAQLRAISPEASRRVQAAIEAMEQTGKEGNEGKFAEAETNSDLAGRLLRQADSAAQKSQQESQSRGRRKRVVGDGYFGKNVVGGDVEIKSEYKVDRRFREDILEDVTTYEGSEEDRTILNGYLRDVVR
ncbi:hypothetical protein MEO40_25330, partial [Dolichospermum sp. ST_sed1]|nr:hypothetical protein [Dolichospermum sp. ST_sed1]